MDDVISVAVNTILGVSKRNVGNWEQGPRHATGATLTLSLRLIRTCITGFGLFSVVYGQAINCL